MFQSHLIKTLLCSLTIATVVTPYASATKPVRTEIITPIHSKTFNHNGKAKERKQGGNSRVHNGVFVFDGSMDGHRQVDPQIAVGNNFILHATNSGLIIYNKKGKFIQGVKQDAFNKGIDPKMFFDIHNRVFGFNLWNPWDKEKKKPVNISISETGDPTGAWNTYPVPAPKGHDGGGNGQSKKWLGYSFPGGPEQTFIMKMAEVKSGKPASVWHFSKNLGQPAVTRDDIEDLYFVNLTKTDIVISRISKAEDGTPEIASVARKPHGFKSFKWPPQSPQKDSKQTTSSGDRRPKNVVVQNSHIWFSHTVNINGRAGIQWHQFKLDATKVQSGTLAHPKNSYIQTTLAVNKNNDVLIGFQETGPDMFISPRFTYHKSGDPAGSTGKIINLGEGQGATDGVAWGDYSGTVIDGDDLTTMWTIQSITDKNGKGDTIIAKVPAPSANE